MEETAGNLAAQRVEHAKRLFDEAWANRRHDPFAVERCLDDLDTAVGLWLESSAADEDAERVGS